MLLQLDEAPIRPTKDGDEAAETYAVELLARMSRRLLLIHFINILQHSIYLTEVVFEVYEIMYLALGL